MFYGLDCVLIGAVTNLYGKFWPRKSQYWGNSCVTAFFFRDSELTFIGAVFLSITAVSFTVLLAVIHGEAAQNSCFYQSMKKVNLKQFRILDYRLDHCFIFCFSQCHFDMNSERSGSARYKVHRGKHRPRYSPACNRVMSQETHFDLKIQKVENVLHIPDWQNPVPSGVSAVSLQDLVAGWVLWFAPSTQHPERLFCHVS